MFNFLGIHSVTCSYCRKTTNSHMNEWRCKSCGSNVGSYLASEFKMTTFKDVKKHWWSRTKSIVDEPGGQFYVVKTKRWESPAYRPEKEEAKTEQPTTYPVTPYATHLF